MLLAQVLNRFHRRDRLLVEFDGSLVEGNRPPEPLDSLDAGFRELA
jgi:hypothetical protein